MLLSCLKLEHFLNYLSHDKKKIPCFSSISNTSCSSSNHPRCVSTSVSNSYTYFSIHYTRVKCFTTRVLSHTCFITASSYDYMSSNMEAETQGILLFTTSNTCLLFCSSCSSTTRTSFTSTHSSSFAMVASNASCNGCSSHQQNLDIGT